MNTDSQKTILIIEDEITITEGFSDYLQDLGYGTLKAENGRIGVDIFKKEKVDLVLVDLYMPVMNGLDVIKYCIEEVPDIPIIVISGANSVSAAVEALHLGAYDYLVKPIIDPHLLGHKVKEALRKAELTRENRVYQEHLEEIVQDRTEELNQANQKLSSVNKRLRKIVETTTRLSGCSGMESFGEKILSEFSDHMLATGGSLYMIEKGGLRLVNSLDPGHASKYLSFPLAPRSVLLRVMESGKPLLVEDVQNFKKIKPSGWNKYVNGSFLVFPIPDGSGKPVALLTLHSKVHPPFVEQDKEVGLILTSYSSETLRSTKAFESLRSSEKLYKTLFDKTNDAIFLVRKKTGRYLDANKAAIELTGRTLEELKHLTTLDIAPKGGAQRLATIENLDGTKNMGVITYHHPDGTQRKARLSIVALDKERVIVIARDVTDEQMMEQQLRRAQKMEAIGHITGGIAHDFNNIIGIILGNISLLKKHIIGDKKALKRLENISKSSQRAADLTKKLLGFSRRQATKVAATNINKVIGEMENMITRSITPLVEVKHELSADLWTTDIDPGDFEDALINLVINARDAMPGGGQLIFETRNVTLDSNHNIKSVDARPGDYVRLSVRDNGIGISSEIQEQIFDPFFSTKPQGKGSGLGLAMVFGFVKRSKGAIEVVSEAGKGTGFQLYLPRSKKNEGKNNIKRTQPDILPRGKEIVLAVDDEAEILELVQETLESLGYRVLTASDGKHAMETLNREPDINLLFSDVVMPGGFTGYELAEEAIKIRPDLKILLTSGFFEGAMTGKNQDILNTNLLRKPYSQAELAQRIRMILDSL